MKIAVAKSAGFCMGVRRAVEMVLDASNLSAKVPVYTYGPLIHNPQVLEMLERKKISIIETIPPKGQGLVLIRAHGVPPEDRQALKEAGFTVIDATCPRVVMVQVIIRKYASRGYFTIIIGDRNHPEVIGLLGYTRDRGFTATSVEELENLPRFKNAAVVAQTTQNTSLYEEIKRWCQNKAPHYKIFHTVCGATERRQAEIRKLARTNDAVVVVGGKESGNTRRLVQIASEAGRPSFHIQDPSEIDYQRMSSLKFIAMTAGASTPNWVIKDTYCKILENNLRKYNIIKFFLFRLRDFLLKTNIVVAAGAGFLTYACSAVQGFSRDFSHSLIAMLYVLSMQILNNLFTIKSDRYNRPERALFYRKNMLYLGFIAACSGLLGLYLAFGLNKISFLILLFMSILGLSYNLRTIPSFLTKGKIRRIKDIPGSRTILIATAWGMVTCLLPAINNKGSLPSFIIAFLFSTGLVFARTAFFDILAVHGDRIAGKETIPILLGDKRSFDLITYILIIDIFIVVLASLTGFLVKGAFPAALVPLFMLFLIGLFKKDSLVSGGHQEFIIELSFIGAGLVSVLI